MSNFTIKDIFRDIFTILRLIACAFYSSIEVFLRNFILPSKFINKRIEKQVVLITGAGKLLTRDILSYGTYFLRVK